jgi:hypothetical protein
MAGLRAEIWTRGPSSILLPKTKQECRTLDHDVWRISAVYGDPAFGNKHASYGRSLFYSVTSGLFAIFVDSSRRSEVTGSNALKSFLTLFIWSIKMK